MRNAKTRLAALLLAVDEQVEVDVAWAPALLARTLASELALDGEEPLEQAARAQVRLDLGRPVQEARLVGLPDRLGLAKGRDVDHAYVFTLVEELERAAD